MKEVTIYTDGACSGNPGPGGWCAILIYREKRREISGFAAATTNNRMEIQAVVEAISALKEPCRIKLHTDSAYVCRAFNDRWLDNWQRNGWQTSSKKPVENRDLWERLLHVISGHDVTFVKVKGHANDSDNNRCDELARAAIQAAAESNNA